MKNKLSTLIILGIIIVVGSTANLVRAQTNSPSLKSSPIATVKPTATDEADRNAQSLKEKIAAKVNELTNETNTAIVGTVADIKKDLIDLKTDNQTILSVAIDETVTKIFDLVSGKKRGINIADLKKGDHLIVSGPKVENTVSANTVYRDKIYELFTASITSTNSEDFVIDVVTNDKEEMILDIEKTTKQNIVDTKTLEIKRVGFSKIKVGDTIHFAIEKSSLKKNRASAIRVLIIPQELFEK